MGRLAGHRDYPYRDEFLYQALGAYAPVSGESRESAPRIIG
jgi:hypothetical protein